MDDFEDLMQPGGGWRDEARCYGDSRFINPDASRFALRLICDSCPVYDDCARWAVGKSGCFAAGSWREPEIIEPWHGKATGGMYNV